MPIMDGYEATKKVREVEDNEFNPLEQRAVIVGLSGHSTDAYKQKAFDSGMDEFITKPLELDKLTQILKAIGLI